MATTATRRAKVRFTVKEGPQGETSIMLEPLTGESLRVFENVVIGFDLPFGTSLEGRKR